MTGETSVSHTQTETKGLHGSRFEQSCYYHEHSRFWYRALKGQLPRARERGVSFAYLLYLGQLLVPETIHSDRDKLMLIEPDFRDCSKLVEWDISFCIQQ